MSYDTVGAPEGSGNTSTGRTDQIHVQGRTRGLVIMIRQDEEGTGRLQTQGRLEVKVQLLVYEGTQKVKGRTRYGGSRMECDG